MKRLPKSYHKEYAPIILNLDDVEYIYNVLRKATDSISIKTDEYELQEPKQLTDLRKDYITRIEFGTREPHMKVDFRNVSSEIWIYEDDPVSMGTFEEINRFLLKKRRLFPILYNPIFVGIPLVIPLTLALFPIYEKTTLYQTIISSSFIASVGWMAYTAFISLKRHSVILLSYKVNTPSWWKRNKDNLVVGIILVLVGVVIGFFFSKFIGQ